MFQSNEDPDLMSLSSFSQFRPKLNAQASPTPSPVAMLPRKTPDPLLSATSRPVKTEPASVDSFPYKALEKIVSDQVLYTVEYLSFRNDSYNKYCY